VALAHHDAAHGDERGGGEAELFRAKQGGDDDVAAGLQFAVGLHLDARAEVVEQEDLLRFGEAEFPGKSRVLDGTERDAPVPPLSPEMSTTSAWALDTPAATVPTPTSETSLTAMRACGLTFFRS